MSRTPKWVRVILKPMFAARFTEAKWRALKWRYRFPNNHP